MRKILPSLKQFVFVMALLSLVLTLALPFTNGLVEAHPATLIQAHSATLVSERATPASIIQERATPAPAKAISSPAPQNQAFSAVLLADDSSNSKAQDSTRLLPLPPTSSYGELPAPAQADAQKQFYSGVYALIQNIRTILGAVAIALIVYAGLRMVIGQGNEDVYTKQRAAILWGIIGLALVGFSGEIVRIFSVYCEGGKDLAGQACTAGGFLKDPNAIVRSVGLFNKQTQIIITFIKYIIGSITVLMIVRNGIRMVTMGSQEDAIAQDKKNLFYSILGLILIIIADTAINTVIYKVDLSGYTGTTGATPGFDAPQAIKEIVGITNFVVSLVGPIAVLALLAGGVMYITSAGNEDTQGKAKRLIFSAVIGILIIYGAFAIVNTIIAGSFSGQTSGQVTQQTGASLIPNNVNQAPKP